MRMTLGSRGKRGLATRSVAIAALLSMLIGSLRTSYADNVARVPSPTPGNAATGKARTPAGKLESDTPWSLPRRVRPTRLVPLDGAADETALARLFDERSDIGLTTSGRPARFRVELPEAFVEAIGFFGAADGSLTVTADGRPLVAETKLAGGRSGWNRLPVLSDAKVRDVVIEWRPAKTDASLRELEIWARVPGDSGASGLPLTDLLHTGTPKGAVELKSASGEQTVALSAAPGSGTGGLFEV